MRPCLVLLSSKIACCTGKGKEDEGASQWNGTTSWDQGFNAFLLSVDVTNQDHVQQLVDVALLSAMAALSRDVRSEVSSWHCSKEVGKVVKEAAARSLEELLNQRLSRGPVGDEDLVDQLVWSQPPAQQPSEAGLTLDQIKAAAMEGAREGGTCSLFFHCCSCLTYACLST
jgi:hypothetical protein